MDNARKEAETRQSSTLIQRTANRRAVVVGDVINGRYLVERLIGEGGVGVVLAAQNVELDEKVALKFLKPEMLGQPDVIARFAREAKAACAIKSEYVCTVYDVGTMPDGQPFLVMEYLDGRNLDMVLRDRGRFGPREAAEYMMQVCEALAAAHAKGIVHRDIKPENLFLATRAGMSIVKVLDFGISKTALTGSIFGSALPLVKTQNLMGSPCYMSPEQVRSAEAVDPRSDIWSVGVVLYELLTGQLPFLGSTITELCASILEQPMAAIAQHREDLPPGYAPIIERCLAKRPEDRYQNVAELAMALLPFAPRRARICAERAVQALRAAGILGEEEFKILSTVPPTEERSSGEYPQIPRAPSTGSFPKIEADAPVASGALAVVSEAQPAKSGRSRSALLFAAAALVALAVGGWLALRGHGTATVAATPSLPSVVAGGATPSAAGVPSEGAGASGAESAAPSSEPRVTSSLGAAPASSPLIGTRHAVVPARPLQTKPALGVTKPPASGKKSAEEPDLGY